MKKYIIGLQLVLSMMFIVSSCDDREGLTVDTAYIEYVWEEPKYKFSRDGISSVQTQEAELLKTPIDRIYNGHLKNANMNYQWVKDLVKDLFEKGIFAGGVGENIATSELHAQMKERIVEDVFQYIALTDKYCGNKKTNVPNKFKTQRAKEGIVGYVGQYASDENAFFVDERGLVLSDAFYYSIYGSIYLDKILNYYLNPVLFQSQEKRNAHESLVMFEGGNYTELEHYFDMAYAYFTFLSHLTESNGLTILKDSYNTIFYAFVQGRYCLSKFFYDDAIEQIYIIRNELSRVFCIRAITYLLGPNTMANLGDEIQYSFLNLSKAYGLIYSLQFTTKEDGTPYFTYNEIKNILNIFLLDWERGFWDKDRLLSDEETRGSLLNVASQICQRYSIDLNDIRR